MTPTLQDRALKALKAVDDSSFVSNIDPQAVHIKGIGLDHAHTIREALRLAADPDWVYVPRESTREMNQAADMTGDVWNVWKAMIAAAPVATTEGKDV